VTPSELAGLIVSREFVLQLHIGAIMPAGLRGHIDLAAFAAAIGPAKV
jgi:ADP-ribose diphosphatase